MRYQSVPTIDLDNQQDGEVTPKKTPFRSVYGLSETWLVFSASFGALICIALNIIIIAIPSLLSNSPAKSSPTSLELVSTYVGLNKAILPETAVPPPPIANFPFLLAQVNASEPRKVYRNTRHFMHRMGTYYPEDRRFLLTPMVNTIAQFRVLDFGMERCTMAIVTPTLARLKESDSNKTLALSDDEVTVNLWRLKAEQLDTRTLSWSTRPKREERLATWRIGPGTTLEAYEFSCPSGSFQTFELECLGNDCSVEFQQDVLEPRLAFLMMQHLSI